MFDYTVAYVLYNGTIYSIDDYYKHFCFSRVELEKEIDKFIKQ